MYRCPWSAASQLSQWEQRSEQREPADGELLMQLEGEASRPIRARLLDISASGMRVTHTCMELAAGQMLRIPAATGQEMRLRVVCGRGVTIATL